MAACLTWGLAEATLFFIVPDVLLTAIALRARRAALAGCVWALLGAMAGGGLMFTWGRLAPQQAWEILAHVPNVSDPMIHQVRREVALDGVYPMLSGPSRGIPYKLYSVALGESPTRMIIFLLWSIPARLPRFLLVTLIAHGLSHAVNRRLDLPMQYVILTLFWLVFYTWYSLAMSS